MTSQLILLFTVLKKMAVVLLGCFLALVVQTTHGSVVNENMYFPRISMKEVREGWQNIYNGMDLSKASYSCTNLVR